MTEFKDDSQHASLRFLDLVAAGAIVVLVFNLTVLLAVYFMHTAAAPPTTVAELKFLDPDAVTVIEKTEQKSTPKQNLEPFPVPPTIDRS
jgi:hypothetical protein